MVRDMNDSKSSVVHKTIFSFYNIFNFTITLSLFDYWLLNSWPKLSWQCEIWTVMGPGCLELLLQQRGPGLPPQKEEPDGRGHWPTRRTTHSRPTWGATAPCLLECLSLRRRRASEAIFPAFYSAGFSTRDWFRFEVILATERWGLGLGPRETTSPRWACGWLVHTCMPST